MVLDKFGTDVSGLKAVAEVLYNKQKRLSFDHFIDVILRLRGGDTASVTDIRELREFLVAKNEDLQHQVASIHCDLCSKFGSMSPSNKVSMRKSDKGLVRSLGLGG